ncbi:hypothetical protein [Brevundimonas sp.]|uniref:hypothetical protein n=1 Tax=Brevundimonas sp. TaxID=1871086 RepID=UPI0019B67F24|nr:hypothetical protein [Brevundimonas sp.]MBD3837747.1 hypothetical protein [Brevundimonas sp.]
MAETYRIRSIQTWAQARDDYLSGLSAETVCRRHDLGLSAFRRRARKYGWRRSDQIEPPPGETDLSIYEDVGLDDQVETAALRFVQALEHGKATEARRWRRLWLELRDASDAMDAEMFPGMSRHEIAAMIAADDALYDDPEEADALRIEPPLSLKVHHCALEKIPDPLSPPEGA